MKRIIVAPHMDDESLGCGGLLAKHSDECLVVTVAEGSAERYEEHRRALEILGIDRSINLGFPDTKVDLEMSRLVLELDRLLAEHRPDEVYLPFPSLHQDHIAVYEAGMRSARISMTPGHWVPNVILVYDIAVYDINLYPSDLRWNVFESLSEEHVDSKAAACAAYTSQAPSGVHPMNSIKELAGSVGKVRLKPFAEQFALVRQVRC